MAKIFTTVKAMIKSDNKVVLYTPNVLSFDLYMCSCKKSVKNLVTLIHDQEIYILQEDLAGETLNSVTETRVYMMFKKSTNRSRL